MTPAERLAASHVHTHYWRVGSLMSERQYTPCRIVELGRRGAALIEFADGHRATAHLFDLKRYPHAPVRGDCRPARTSTPARSIPRPPTPAPAEPPDPVAIEQAVAAEIAAWSRRDRVLGEQTAVGRRWRMLVYLYWAHAQRGVVYVGALSTIGGPPTTGLRVIGDLEREGFVTRHADPFDLRRAIVELTAAGRRSVAACFAAPPTATPPASPVDRLERIERQLAEIHSALVQPA